MKYEYDRNAERLKRVLTSMFKYMFNVRGIWGVYGDDRHVREIDKEAAEELRRTHDPRSSKRNTDSDVSAKDHINER